MPSSLATCATTGAAPVPVPPPMPLVMLQPICSAVFTLACFRACESVLMHMNSTPSMPLVTMWATAFPPPPPTPITLMTALWLYASINSNMFIALLLLGLSASKVALEPRTHTVEDRFRVAAQGAPATYGHSVVTGVEQEPNTRGKDRIAYDVQQALHRLRQAEANGHVENFFSKLDGAFHLGAAARKNDAGGDDFLEAAAAQLFAHEAEQFLVARLHDLVERLTGETPRRSIADARHLDALIGIGEL